MSSIAGSCGPFLGTQLIAFQNERVAQHVRALARAKDLDRASWKGLKNAILEGANALRTASGQIDPPIQLDKILCFRAIRRTWFPSNSSPEATLAPTSAGFTLRLRPGVSRVRSRFSQAHEVAHTFFYDLRKSPPEKLLHLSPGSEAYRKQEDICNAFAGVLLLPDDLVRQFLTKSQERGLSKWDTLAGLSAKFEVSSQVAARRLLSDFEMFRHTVAIFVDGVRGPSTLTGSVRRLRGHAMTSPRVAESEILESLTNMLTGAPHGRLEDRLRRIADGASKIATVSWKLAPWKDGGYIPAVLVDFDASRLVAQ